MYCWFPGQNNLSMLERMKLLVLRPFTSATPLVRVLRDLLPAPGNSYTVYMECSMGLLELQNSLGHPDIPSGISEE